jgi:hypothetical protein
VFWYAQPGGRFVAVPVDADYRLTPLTGDFDGDGESDLAYLAGDHAAILRGPAFTDGWNVAGTFGYLQERRTDLDGDGRDDLVLGDLDHITVAFDHGGADPELARIVDVHAFVPEELAAHARAAGLEDVRVRGEELLANWFGWMNRTLEATALPEDIPWLWRQYAFRGYLALQRVDVALLEGRLPPQVFYNLMVAGRKPR